MKDLRERRLAKEITIAELARRSGISISAIGKIERGEFAPTDDTKERIERGLNGYYSKRRKYILRHAISDPEVRAELRKIWLRDHT